MLAARAAEPGALGAAGQLQRWLLPHTPHLSQGDTGGFPTRYPVLFVVDILELLKRENDGDFVCEEEISRSFGRIRIPLLKLSKVKGALKVIETPSQISFILKLKHDFFFNTPTLIFLSSLLYKVRYEFCLGFLNMLTIFRVESGPIVLKTRRRIRHSDHNTARNGTSPLVVLYIPRPNYR